MSKRTLEILFDSRSRVKILKLLFRNPERLFTVKEISQRIQEDPMVARRELKKLEEIYFVKNL